MNRAYFNGLKAVAQQKDEALLLDLFPDAAAAFSLRKLRAAYTGAAIRVRRSSDDAEQDIGFDVNGNLDTAALLAFVGSEDGFVARWYDQGLNTLNANQSVIAEQPIIASQGAVKLLNGKPTILFQNASQHFETASISLNESTAVVYGDREDGNFRYKFCINNGNFRHSLRNNVIEAEVGINGTNYTTSGSAWPLNTPVLFFIEIDNPVKLFSNGVEILNMVSATPAAVGSLRINRAAGSLNLGVEGNTSELILWDSNKGTSRDAIENNINNYYNVF